jgi:5'-nucleotidase
MNIKSILLTGDDGYNSTGTRLLIYALKDKYDLTVVGTKEQQSGVGGKMQIATGFNWQETKVDGQRAFAIDGTPTDAMEFAATYFKQPFDLTISGVNWGANLGSLIFSSGTINAALRAVSTHLSQKTIAMSWDLPPEFYLIDHQHINEVENFIEYPGNSIKLLLDLIFKNDFWQAEFLNVNFPRQITSQVKLTKMIPDAKAVYDYGDVAYDGSKAGHFDYRAKRLSLEDLNPEYDVKALTDGFISITPCLSEVTDHQIFEQLKGEKFAL